MKRGEEYAEERSEAPLSAEFPATIPSGTSSTTQNSSSSSSGSSSGGSSSSSGRPSSQVKEDVTTCKHDLSGRLYRMARNYKDNPVANDGLLLFDAFLHVSNKFAYVMFQPFGVPRPGRNFIKGEKELAMAMNVTWSCFWVSPEDPTRLLHTATDSQWQNRTFKGHGNYFGYDLLVVKCDAGMLTANGVSRPLMMNVSASMSNNVLAHWEKVLVCHEPLSPTPIKSVVCTGCLRVGRNPHSGVQYIAKSMDKLIKTWVEYSLRIGFDMVSRIPSSTLIPFFWGGGGGLGSLLNPFKQKRAPFLSLGYWAA